jgi:glutamyl-tRNA reductase
MRLDCRAACTSSTRHQLRQHFAHWPGAERAVKPRKHKPMFMVDLAVPRDID